MPSESALRSITKAESFLMEGTRAPLLGAIPAALTAVVGAVVTAVSVVFTVLSMLCCQGKRLSNSVKALYEGSRLIFLVIPRIVCALLGIAFCKSKDETRRKVDTTATTAKDETRRNVDTTATTAKDETRRNVDTTATTAEDFPRLLLAQADSAEESIASFAITARYVSHAEAVAALVPSAFLQPPEDIARDAPQSETPVVFTSSDLLPELLTEEELQLQSYIAREGRTMGRPTSQLHAIVQSYILTAGKTLTPQDCRETFKISDQLNQSTQQSRQSLTFEAIFCKKMEVQIRSYYCDIVNNRYCNDILVWAKNPAHVIEIAIASDQSGKRYMAVFRPEDLKREDLVAATKAVESTCEEIEGLQTATTFGKERPTAPLMRDKRRSAAAARAPVDFRAVAADELSSVAEPPHRLSFLQVVASDAQAGAAAEQPNLANLAVGTDELPVAIAGATPSPTPEAQEGLGMLRSSDDRALESSSSQPGAATPSPTPDAHENLATLPSPNHNRNLEGSSPPAAAAAVSAPPQVVAAPVPIPLDRLADYRHLLAKAYGISAAFSIGNAPSLTLEFPPESEGARLESYVAGQGKVMGRAYSQAHAIIQSYTLATTTEQTLTYQEWEQMFAAAQGMSFERYFCKQKNVQIKSCYYKDGSYYNTVILKNSGHEKEIAVAFDESGNYMPVFNPEDLERYNQNSPGTASS